MKKALLFLFLAGLAGVQAQTNSLAENKRFIRGGGTDPTLQTFVIPLDGQKGMELLPTGNSAGTLNPNNVSPWTPPWFIRIAKAARKFVATGTPIDFENPIVAFGSRGGGTPLYTGQEYSFGTFFGGRLDDESTAYELVIYAYPRTYLDQNYTNVSPVDVQVIRVPRRGTPEWDTFAANGYRVTIPDSAWYVDQTPGLYGLETVLQLVESSSPEGMWGVESNYLYPSNFTSPCVLTHKATSASYYFKVECTGYYKNSSGQWVPMAQNADTSPAFNTLYTLDFEARPAWRSTFIHAPQFSGDPMPPEYFGKSQEELAQIAGLVTKQFDVPTAGMSNTDTSPELRDHPELQALVDSLGGDPLALANYVLNEIELTDALSYNENGTVSEQSLNAGGMSRGALATYLEGQGSPAEQCGLLVYLLRKAGIPAAYANAPHNELKMLDKRMSQILKMQIRGGVDAQGNSDVPHEIPVNYPWVTAYVPDAENPGQSKWVHIFPWIKDTEIKEGLDLYDQMPEGYKSGYAWVRKYLFNDSEILSLDSENDTPARLFPLFIEKALRDNHPELSISDLGIQVKNRRHLYARWEDFPQPWAVTEENGQITQRESFADTPDTFDTVAVQVWSDRNNDNIVDAGEPNIETGDLRAMDLHNRRLLIRHEQTGVNTHNLIVSLAAFRPSATGTGDFSDPALLNRQAAVRALDSSDDVVRVKTTFKRHRSLPGSFSPPATQSESFLGITHSLVIEETRNLRKGDTSALCLSSGRVTNRMLMATAAEFWQAEQVLKANPLSPGDPEVFQGGAAYLMGMSYFENHSRFVELAQNLHKVHQVSSVMMGLATLRPQREADGSLPNDGEIHLQYPALDMFFQSTAFAGNGSLHADSSVPYVQAGEDFFNILTAHGSAQEHQTINDFFGKTDSVSTVKLLHLAQEQSRPMVEITNFNVPVTGVLAPTIPGTPYTVDVNGTPTTKTLYEWDPGMTLNALGGFLGNVYSDYRQVFFTPGPVLGASGDYFGMGAFIVDKRGSGALIASNQNGGFGSALSFGGLDALNFFNLSLSLGDSFTLSLGGPSPSDPWQMPDLWQPWDFDSLYSGIDSGAYLLDAFQSDYTTAGANALNSSGSQADNLAKVENSGWPGWAEWFGTAWSTAGAIIGDPVHSVTGSFYIDAVDLTLPGPMPLQIRRSYTSQNIAENEFGFGWKLAYFPFLSVATGDALISAAEMDGSVITYRQQSANLWTPQPKDNPTLCNMTGDVLGSVGNMFNAKIVKSTEGSDTIYTLTGPDGSTRRFKVRSFASGGLNRTRPYLETWTDHRGNFFSCSYGTDATKGDFGQLTRIVSSNGSFVGFTFNTYGRITDAFTGDGRRVRYEYDGFGDLVKVTRPDASVVGYDYKHITDGVTYSNHLIIRERKPEGRILENDYDDFRRVTEQRATVGTNMTPVRNATFEYYNTKDTDPLSPYFNTLSGYTLVRDAYDRETRYDYVGGQITTITDPLLHTISQQWYAPGDTSTGAFPRSLAQRIDKRGLTQNFYYDAAGNLDYQTTTGDLTGDGVAETATTDYTFNALNLPELIVDPMSNRTAIYYTDPARPRLPTRIESRTSSALISQTVNVYTDVISGGKQAMGLLQRTTLAEGSPDAAATEWTYDNRGFPLTKTQFTGTTDPDVVTTYVFNGRGEEIERKDSAGRKVVSAYDDMGRRSWEEYWETSGRIGWNYRYFNGNGEVEWTDGPRYAPEDYVWRKYDGAGRPSEELIWRSASNTSGTGVAAGLPEASLYTNSFFVHNLFGDLTEIHNPLGNTAIMTHDGIGQLLTRTFYAGTSTVMASESFTREPGGQPATHTNPLGGVTSYFYTSTGKLRRQENPDNTVLEWRYRLDGRVEREAVNHNNYYQVDYNDAARTVTKTLKTLGGATLATESRTLDRRGNVTSETDLAGATWTRSFDGLNRPKTATGPAATANAAQQSSTYTYDAAGETTSVTNALGEKTVTQTDIMGRTKNIEVRDSGDTLVHKTAHAYSPDNNSVTTTIGTGDDAVSSTTFTDTTGAEVLKINGNGEKTIFARNQQGLLRQIIDPLSRTTQIEYDALDRPWRTTYPNSSTEVLGHDAAGNITLRTMNNTLKWVAEYDSAGRMTLQKKQNASGSATSRLFTYDYYPSGPMAGLLQTVHDPRGVTFTSSYNDFRRLETVVAAGSLSAQNQTLTYSYDARGILETVAQTGGAQPDSTVTRAISPYGQVTNESVDFDGETTSFSQTWDGAGRRITLGAGPGFGYGFNAAGQLTSVSAGGNSFNSYFTTAGLLSSRSNPFRTQTVTDRDGAGRILTQTVTAGSATPLSETQTWLADGRLDTYSAVRVGTGAWDEFRDYDYNSRGYLTKESFVPRPSASEDLTYGFDALGLRIAAKVGAGGNSNWFANVTSVYTTREVAVDSINNTPVTSSASGVAFGAARVELEVDGVAVPDVTHPGWQDATGAWSANLTLSPGQHSLAARAVHPSGWKTDPVTNTFTVNGTPQTATNYSYDQTGNLVWRSWSGGKDQVFTWDAQGRLVSVADFVGGYPASTWTAAYDGFGRRLRTTTTPDGGATTTINSSFDPQAEFLEIGVNVNGAQLWKVHGPDLNGAFGALNGTGGLEAVISPEGTTGAINDAFGNVVASVGANNTVAWSPVKVGSYGPLPNSTGRTLESGTTLIEASAWRNRRLDPTGYINLGARHYDPTAGRFISPDPLGHSSSWSLYDFASADGVNNFDGDGRLATGFSSGWSGTQSSSSSNSWAYNFGLNSGATNSGFYSGLGQGLDNFNNTVTFGLYDRMGWSNSASNTGWENDLSRSFATIPRDVATGAVIGGAVNVVSETASGLVSSLTNTATLAKGASIPLASPSTALSTIRQTTLGETFLHYGYAEQAAGFAGGLRVNGFATTVSGLSGTEAQAGLALPRAIPPNAVYTVSPQPGTLIRVNPVTAPQFGQPGGLPEFQFPMGTAPGTVSTPTLLP